MWFKNIKTGVEWFVTGELQERLSRSSEYEVIMSAEAEPEPEPDAEDMESKDDEQRPEAQIPVKTLEGMTYQELRALAKERGIEEYYKMDTVGLRAALKDGE